MFRVQGEETDQRSRRHFDVLWTQTLVASILGSTFYYKDTGAGQCHFELRRQVLAPPTSWSAQSSNLLAGKFPYVPPWDSCILPEPRLEQTEASEPDPIHLWAGTSPKTHPHGPCIHWHGDLAMTTIRILNLQDPRVLMVRNPGIQASLTSRLALALDRASTICAWGPALNHLGPSYSCPESSPHPPMGQQ